MNHVSATSMKKKKELLLPEKLSDCIELALKDLNLIVNDSNYTIDFENWHKPIKNQFSNEVKCSVCFAGSIMAKTFKKPIKDGIHASDFTHYNEERFNALDYVRKGWISAALGYMDITHPTWEEDINQNDYIKFVKQMKKIIKKLRKKNL